MTTKCERLSYLLNAMLQVKAKFVFLQFSSFFGFRTQSAKNCSCVLPYSVAVSGYRTFSKKDLLGKREVIVQKSVSEKKYIGINNSLTRKLFLFNKSTSIFCVSPIIDVKLCHNTVVKVAVKPPCRQRVVLH